MRKKQKMQAGGGEYAVIIKLRRKRCNFVVNDADKKYASSLHSGWIFLITSMMTKGFSIAI